MIEIPDLDYFISLISEISEKKSYSVKFSGFQLVTDLNLTYDIAASAIKVKSEVGKCYDCVGFDVWEVKDPVIMLNYCEPLELVNCRKIRKHIKKYLDSLLRLICVVDKAKLAADIDSIDKAYANFSKVNLEEVTLKEKEVKTNKKTPKQKQSLTNEDNEGPSKDLKDKENENVPSAI